MAFLPTPSQCDDIRFAVEPIPTIFTLVGLPCPFEAPQEVDTSMPRLLFRALGNPATLLDLALIPTDVYLATVSGLDPLFSLSLPGNSLSRSSGHVIV